MSIIAISQQKGGVLKTTLATHLASVLALEGESVLIIDTDSQSNVALSFHKNPEKIEYSLYEVLQDDIPTKLAIINVFQKGEGKIDILPSTDSLMAFTEIPKPKGKFNVLKEKLGHLEKEYDYILIDTPPSLGVMLGNVFNYADEVLIPFNPEQFSRRSLVKILDTVEDFQKELNPKLKVMGIVPTIVDVRTNLHTDILADTRKLADKRNVKMFYTVIPKSIRYSSSIGYDGTPLVLSQPSHYMSKIYFTLWEEIEHEQKVN